MTADVPAEPRYFGQSVKRCEDPRFLLGRARYVDDIPFAGAVHAAFVRSDEAHARIVRVDTTAARAMEGVVAVITGRDAADSCTTVRWAMCHTRRPT